MDSDKFPQPKPEYLPELRSRADGSTGRPAIRVPGRRHAGWADVRALVRVAPPGEETWSMVELLRPHVLIGRKPGCDITIAHNDLEPIHAYLHFDDSGCYAVDMRTATGIRINGRAVTHGPLFPGDLLEVGGFRIQMDGILVNGQPIAADQEYGQSPLGTEPFGHLVGLKLQSLAGSSRFWKIKSRIAFVGSEQGCAVALTDNPAASRIHGVIVRTETTIHFVDLISKGTHINGEHLSNESRELFQSDVLSIGRRGFTVHRDDSRYAGQNVAGQEIVVHANGNHDRHRSASDPMNSEMVLATLLNRIQTQHDDALERQNELHVAMAQLLRQVQSEQSRVLEKHLDRIQKMDAEIASLRSQIANQNRQTANRRSLSAPAPAPNVIPDMPGMNPGTETTAPAPAPNSKPINLKKVKTLRSQDTSETPEYTTAWLLDRVSHLEREQSSAWRELLGRIRGR